MGWGPQARSSLAGSGGGSRPRAPRGVHFSANRLHALQQRERVRRFFVFREAAAAALARRRNGGEQGIQAARPAFAQWTQGLASRRTRLAFADCLGSSLWKTPCASVRHVVI
ncbi:unnamed protein product [Prorocentrum cordatum]|uniref:Uncharacterized protein n=1 Tax=Prorocentrum cordatum TaxID=2364126 RepID=A0ABN9QE20_9DINO|nr:unnamed protein product [Polarella glacialis]